FHVTGVQTCALPISSFQCSSCRTSSLCCSQQHDQQQSLRRPAQRRKRGRISRRRRSVRSEFSSLGSPRSLISKDHLGGVGRELEAEWRLSPPCRRLSHVGWAPPRECSGTGGT